MIRMLVLPRDPNPYQGLLYGALGRLGVRVCYLGELTRSHTVNLLLLPAELAWHRMAGARVVHLHWVAARSRCPVRAGSRCCAGSAQAWFLIWLRACRALGLRLVWTAHNVLPHEQVFADDIAARRALARASDLVLAHSAATLAALAALGAAPRRSAVIPHGPLPVATPAAPLRRPGSAGGPRRFLFFGRVQGYKGVTDLLAAFAALPAETPAELTVAGPVPGPAAPGAAAGAGPRRRSPGHAAPGPRPGQCGDRPAGRGRRRRAAVPPGNYQRQCASWRSATAARSSCLTCPGWPACPGQALLRYDGSIPGLAGALARLALAEPPTLATMSAAALSYAAGLSWPDIAQRTLDEISSPCSAQPRAAPARQPASTS